MISRNGSTRLKALSLFILVGCAGDGHRAAEASGVTTSKMQQASPSVVVLRQLKNALDTGSMLNPEYMNDASIEKNFLAVAIHRRGDQGWSSIQFKIESLSDSAVEIERTVRSSKPVVDGRPAIDVRVSVRGLKISEDSVKQVFGLLGRESDLPVRNHLPSKAVKALQYTYALQGNVLDAPGIYRTAVFNIDLTGGVVESKFVTEGYEK
jgi:hypothetical protein